MTTKSIRVFSAPWYPGHRLLEAAVAAASEKAGRQAEFHLVDVEADLAAAEDAAVVSLPTAILYRGDKERRRLTGAIGLVELCGLAGVRTRARKVT